MRDEIGQREKRRKASGFTLHAGRALALAALGLGGLAGCGTLHLASHRESQPAGETLRERRARERVARIERTREDTRPFDASRLPPLPEGVLSGYTDLVTRLTGPEMEGRKPGTPGIERAAALIEAELRALGLTPAFMDSNGTPTFRQTIERGVVASAGEAFLRAAPVGAPSLDARPGAGLGVLGFSGTGSVSGPVVFCGYSISSGPNGYLNYPPDANLKGKVALILAHEPMNDNGRSRWASQGWSYAGNLSAKVSAAARRDAAAIVVVAPTAAVAAGAPEIVPFDPQPPTYFDNVPVVMVSADVGDALVRGGGHDLDELIERANASPVLMDLPGVTAEVSAVVTREPVLTSNIGAVLPGRGALAGEYIVVGAHYDHLGHGPEGSRAPDRAGEVHPGADDNASGTAAALLAARVLAADAASEPNASAPDTRSVLFLLFTAEEEGLIGSKHYVDNPIAPLRRHALMINMDMIGRVRDGRLEVAQTDDSPSLSEFLTPHLADTRLRIRENTTGRGRSDHANFDAAGVPFVLLHTGLHEEYHTPDDTLETINFDGGARVGLLAASLAGDARTRPGALFAESRPAPKPVRLGLVPEQGGGAGGLRVRRVFAGSAAEKAGIKEGDVLTRWDGAELKSPADLQRVLSEGEPGQRVRVTLMRGGEEQRVEVVLEAQP